MTWLPTGFAHPVRVAVGDGYHLRPITAADADLDYPAVLGSQPQLWSIFGPARGWPAVVDAQAGTGLERAWDVLVPTWIGSAWPFTQPRYIGRDLSWADWLARPDV